MHWPPYWLTEQALNLILCALFYAAGLATGWWVFNFLKKGGAGY